MIAVGISAVLAAMDLLIKARIEAQEENTFPHFLPYTGEKISVQKYHNDGFPFGFMRDNFRFVQMAALAMTSAVAGVLGFLATKKGSNMEKIGLAFVLGGAVSNLYDRLVRKYVVDYFTIEAGVFKKVIFNLGDMFVFFGTLLLLAVGTIRDLRS